jgi:hypothetical protein
VEEHKFILITMDAFRLNNLRACCGEARHSDSLLREFSA